MATKQFNSRIQWKKDTSSNWTKNNPVLLNGEIAIVVTNTGETRFKVGDGTSSYTALPFQDEAVRALITAADDKIDAHIADTDNPHEVTKAQIGLSNVDNVKQYSASNPPPYPVTSVNGMKGAVNLDASDVGARPDTWVPTLSNLGITATASELNKLDGATVTTQEINYLDGVSSSIQTQLNGKVPTSRTVNSKALSSNITLSAADVDAVPTSRTVNGKPLSSNITLSASDVGALSTAGGTLTGNLTGKYLTGTWLQSTAVTNLNSSNYKGICIFDGSGWVYYRTAEELRADIGAVPTSRKINGKALSADISLTAADVGADAAGAASGVQTSLTSHTNNKSNPHAVTKAQVGLGNVDNTSDANKPISTATQNALNGKANTSHTHAASNITSGTLSVARGGTGQTTLTPAVTTKGVRQIYAGTSDMTAGTTALTTGRIYLVYE